MSKNSDNFAEPNGDHNEITHQVYSENKLYRREVSNTITSNNSYGNILTDDFPEETNYVSGDDGRDDDGSDDSNLVDSNIKGQGHAARYRKIGEQNPLQTETGDEPIPHVVCSSKNNPESSIREASSKKVPPPKEEGIKKT